jgi:transposase InsO family protein
MASENPTWGYTRIRDALGNLGLELCRSTVQTILREHGVDPAPERRNQTSWRTFLASHWDALAACDFFSVEVLMPVGLVRYYVFFVIELQTRRIKVAGIVHQPYGEWMVQVARNLLDCEDGFLLRKKHLILDRDPVYTHEFRKLLRESGVNPVRLPARSPDLNAYAERFVLSIKSECLDKLVLIGERHLHQAVRDYVDHYHHERNHQGLDGQIIRPLTIAGAPSGPIKCHERLGGLLRYYHRKAA